MNPNVVAARVRNVILKVGLVLGGIVLLRDVYRLLVSPGGWDPLVLSQDFPEVAARLDPPGFLIQISSVRAVWNFLESSWSFVSLPLGAILTVAVIYVLYNYVIVPVFHLLARIYFLIAGRFSERAKLPRHIIVCIDGTWNYPDKVVDGIPAFTNVFAFWENLLGERRRWREWTVGADRVKTHTEGGVEQIGLYFPGVGNPATYSTLGIIVGGAFGFGAKNLRKQAYRDLIRYYRSDRDKITIVGFSRGAAISRMLASKVDDDSLPHLTLSDTLLGRFLVGLGREVFPGWNWIQKRDIDVDFLGIWDTVAAFGISKNVLGIPFQRINLFTDMNVAASVRKVVHLAALDEQRDSFIPTLVDPPKPRADGTMPETDVDEVWFPGVHANVGGGFASDGLAKVSLQYMVRRFQQHYEKLGVPVFLATDDFKGDAESNYCDRIRPSNSALYDMEPRFLPDNAVLHHSVFRRMAKEGLRYKPQNVSELIARLDARRALTVHDLDTLNREGLLRGTELTDAKAALKEECSLHSQDEI